VSNIDQIFVSAGITLREGRIVIHSRHSKNGLWNADFARPNIVCGMGRG
jgi:hypothetical protein